LTGLWASYRADSAGVLRAIAALDALAVPDSTGDGELARLRADVLRLAMPNAIVDRAVLARADSVLATGPAVAADSRAAMNLMVARAFERTGDVQHASRAANRVSPGEVLYIMGTPAARDQARLHLAAGDTSIAIRIWQFYLRNRRAAEPPQRRDDEKIQQKLDELLRAKR